MADIKAKLKSKKTGDVYHLETLAELVKNAQGETLENVEAGAQVNKLEGVKVNGVAQQIGEDKVVNITIATASEYTIVKQEVAEEGYASTYYLTKDGIQAGEKINIAKDMVLDKVELKTCEEAGTPVVGYKEGDKYIEFTFLNKEASKLYLLVTDLVDVYTAGNGITVAEGKISINTTDTTIQGDIEADSTKFVQAGKIHTALAGKQATIEDLETIRSNATAGKSAADTIAKYGDIVSHNAKDFAEATHKHEIDDVTGLQEALNGKQAAITGAATTITSDDLTASKALVSTEEGKVGVSTVTTTELSLLSGMTDMLIIEPIE